MAQNSLKSSSCEPVSSDGITIACVLSNSSNSYIGGDFSNVHTAKDTSSKIWYAFTHSQHNNNGVGHAPTLPQLSILDFKIGER